MKFYNRKNELKKLGQIRKEAYKTSKMSVITGRRRIGKTELLRKAYPDCLYLFVSKKNERILCEEFISLISEYFNVKIFGRIEKFKEVFEYLMKLSEKRPFTLVIDEFQEFISINSSVYSDMQNIWDQYRKSAKMNLVMSGSIYSLMTKIFESRKEPLFGRADTKIFMKGFSIETLGQIIKTTDKACSNWDLLCFYMFTGGVPKYVEIFADKKAFKFDEQLDIIFDHYSMFIDEGKNLLIEEFGKEYSVYFSILSLLASSKTSRGEIESILERNTGGYLDRLENEYSVIKKIRPVFSRPGTRSVKYEISDNFLSFWFRFIYKYRSAIEIENYDYVKNIVKRDIGSYSGKYLEKYFVEKMKLKNRYSVIGRYWESKNKNEIDIVAVNDHDARITVCEVKMNSDKIDISGLKRKARNISERFREYEIDYRGYSLENM